jgi:hypothetical protein
VADAFIVPALTLEHDTRPDRADGPDRVAVVGGGVAFALLRGKTVYREIPA